VGFVFHVVLDSSLGRVVDSGCCYVCVLDACLMGVGYVRVSVICYRDHVVCCRSLVCDLDRMIGYHGLGVCSRDPGLTCRHGLVVLSLFLRI